MKYVTSAAEFSSDRRYRYSLTRIWDRKAPMLLVCGLNPSKAGASHDDQTVRKWVGFADRLKYGGFIAVNLFAWIATSPADLVKAARRHDIVGPLNDLTLFGEAARADRIIVCWGVQRYPERAAVALKLMNNPESPRKFWCWGRTRDGHPRHPLRLAYATPLERFKVTG